MKCSLFVIIMFCMTSLVYAQEAPRKPVGEIVELKGRAYLKEDGPKRRELTSRDKGRFLYAEQELSCLSKCDLRFKIGRREISITHGRYLIPNLINPFSSLKTSVRAGAKRAESDVLLSPVENNTGLVSSEFFRFRWRMLKINNEPVNISPLSISLHDCKTDEHIWSETNIDYKSGSYVSDEVRRLLRRRQQQDSTTSMEVVVTTASFEKKQRFCFNLISVNEEQRLRNALAQWDQYADLIRHVERAFVFYQHKLYDEAAGEFDMALQLSPNTDYLLADTIKAHYMLGDTDRVDDLINRLGNLIPRSDLYIEILTLTGKQKNN